MRIAGIVRIAILGLAAVLLLALPAFAAQMERPITAWPFFVREISDDKAETDLLWPLFHYERNKTYERYAFRPFIFSTEKDPSRDFRRTSVLWPISVYNHEGTKTTYRLFPFYWYKDSPKSRYSVLFPVYWNGEGPGRSWFHVWPLFGVNRKGATYSEYSTLYPFFRYASDSATGELEINAPWPLIHYHVRGESVSHGLLPLYWYARTPAESRGFVFPYYWRKSPDQEAHGLLPLWYSSRAPGAKTDLVFPLYFNRRTADEDFRIITPLYFSRKTADRETSALLPLYFSSDAPDRHYRYIFPLYFSNWTDERSFRTFFPIYYDLKTADSRLQVGLPVYLGYKTASYDFSMVFPFYYHRDDHEQKSAFTYFFPFYGSYRRGEFVSRHFVFFPLYSRFKDDETQTRGWDLLWPVLHHEYSPSSSETRVLPFFLRKRAPDDEYTIGFPFYWWFRTGESSIRHFVPFYGEHVKGDWYRKRYILGPLYMDTRDDHARLSRQDAFFYLYSRSQEGEKSRGWLFPFYYHRQDPESRFTLASPAFLPPYYINSRRDDRELFHIWPFYGKYRKGSYEENSVLWPLFRVGNDAEKNESMTHILLYYRERKGTDTFSFFFPLWEHRSTTERTADCTLFLYCYEHLESKDRTDLSLLWLVPPRLSLFRYESEPGAVKHRLFPLYSYSYDEKTDALSWSALWLLFSYNSQGEFARQTDVLWKFITYERKDAETYDFRILWRFIRSSRTPTSSVFEFNPFYYSEQEEGKGSYWAIFGGLFGVETIGEQKKYRVFWIF